MGDRKKAKISYSDIISASEIGQYYFCSNAWYLQKCGYKPISPQLEVGIKKHKELGEIIDSTERDIEKSNIYALIGILLFIISLTILFFEVIV
jgi:hypothetical protein